MQRDVDPSDEEVLLGFLKALQKHSEEEEGSLPIDLDNLYAPKKEAAKNEAAKIPVSRTPSILIVLSIVFSSIALLSAAIAILLVET